MLTQNKQFCLFDTKLFYSSLLLVGNKFVIFIFPTGGTECTTVG